MMVLRQQEDLMVGEVETLKHVCQSLEKIDVPYMLTGSFAANFYAVPRMTRDIDIVVEILSPDIDKFCRTFQDVYYLLIQMFFYLNPNHKNPTIINDMLHNILNILCLQKLKSLLLGKTKKRYYP